MLVKKNWLWMVTQLLSLASKPSTSTSSGGATVGAQPTNLLTLESQRLNHNRSCSCVNPTLVQPAAVHQRVHQLLGHRPEETHTTQSERKKSQPLGYKLRHTSAFHQTGLWCSN